MRWGAVRVFRMGPRQDTVADGSGDAPIIREPPRVKGGGRVGPQEERTGRCRLRFPLPRTRGRGLGRGVERRIARSWSVAQLVVPALTPAPAPQYGGGGEITAPGRALT